VAYTEVMFPVTSPKKAIPLTISNNITTNKAGSELTLSFLLDVHILWGNSLMNQLSHHGTSIDLKWLGHGIR
jgi:hypothetical protein